MKEIRIKYSMGRRAHGNHDMLVEFHDEKHRMFRYEMVDTLAKLMQLINVYFFVDPPKKDTK